MSASSTSIPSAPRAPGDLSLEAGQFHDGDRGAGSCAWSASEVSTGACPLLRSLAEAGLDVGEIGELDYFVFRVAGAEGVAGAVMVVLNSSARCGVCAVDEPQSLTIAAELLDADRARTQERGEDSSSVRAQSLAGRPGIHARARRRVRRSAR